MIDDTQKDATGETTTGTDSAPSLDLEAAATLTPAVATGRERFLAACRGEPTLPIPIWLMRQAGRYLEEYRAVRQRVDFLTLCKTPELAAEVTLQPLRRFALDAAILFCDIMVPVEPMGLSLDFKPGPVIDPPLRCRADIERLRVPEAAEGLEYVLEAIRRIRVGIGPERALLGFAGSPVTLATYMCEGGPVKQFTQFKSLLHADPPAAHELLERLSRVVIGFLRAQIEAGCDCVQLFDTWAGQLDPFDFREFVVPHVQRIIATLQADAAGAAGSVPIIYFCRDANSVLELLPSLGAPAYGLDWRVDVERARRVLAPYAIQGNLDPVLLVGGPDFMERRAHEILAASGGVGHIFNLGHGILPTTPPEHVARLVDAVHAWRPTATPGPTERS